MSTPFLGEIRLMSFQFAVKGWALCNGQLMAINTNQALFSLLGTTYGGNGTTNFALPNLQGRVPMGQGSTTLMGQAGGAQYVTLTLNQMPAHSHELEGTSDFANANVPGQALPGARPRGGLLRYAVPGNPATLSTSSIGTTGGNQPHDNMQPYLTMNYQIALEGIFPSRN